MSIQDYNSMISLYTEIEATVSSKMLAQIETPDSEIARKIAQDFFLVSRETKKDGKTEVTLHFQKKHFYDFVWGKVRSFFGCEPAKSFAFTSNFDLIKRKLESIPQTEVQEPEKLERLRNIANALVRHVEGKSHTLDHEITRTFLATTIDRVISDATTPIAPSRVTSQAPTPLNPAEKKFVDLLRADQKGDRAFLSALMKNLSDSKSQDWKAIHHKGLFEALGHRGESLRMDDLCKQLHLLFKQASPDSKLDLIVDSLQHAETLHLDDFIQSYDNESRAKKSKEYQAISLLSKKSEASLSAAEKIALKVSQVREFLQQVKKGDSATVAACQQLLSLIETIAKVEGSLGRARADVKNLKSLPDCVKVPQVPALVNISQIKTIMDAINAYENASVAIGDVERLKALQDKFLAFQADLGKIKEDVKSLRAKFDNSLLPCAAPLFDEIEGRTLYHDFYGKDFGGELPFQNDAQFEGWLNNQVELMQEYRKGLTALSDMDVHSREELKTRILEKKWPAPKSDPAKAFRANADNDMHFAEAKVDEEPRITKFGFFNRLYQVQNALLEIPELARYNFDKYIEALSYISQAFKDAIGEYDKVWQRAKDGKTISYKEERELFEAFSKQQQMAVSALKTLQEGMEKLRKSARTEYLVNLTHQFEEKIPQKATPVNNKVLALTVVANPSRLSNQTVFDRSTPPAEFDKAQKAYLEELKVPEPKGGATSFFNLIKEKGKKEESPSKTDDEQDWGA